MTTTMTNRPTRLLKYPIQLIGFRQRLRIQGDHRIDPSIRAFDSIQEALRDLSACSAAVRHDKLY